MIPIANGDRSGYAISRQRTFSPRSVTRKGSISAIAVTSNNIDSCM